MYEVTLEPLLCSALIYTPHEIGLDLATLHLGGVAFAARKVVVPTMGNSRVLAKLRGAEEEGQMGGIAPLRNCPAQIF